MRKYFGTDGIRKIANTELTPKLAFDVAKASAYVFAKNNEDVPTILIGRDTRISGELIESSMIAGFLSYGVNVISLGVIPTPAVAFLTKKLNASAGVVISASHNSLIILMILIMNSSLSSESEFLLSIKFIILFFNFFSIIKLI